MSKDLYVKIFDKSLISLDMQYHIGLNIDSNEFNPEPKCGNGLHYTNFEHFEEYLDHGEMIGFVTIPDGIPIVKIDETKYKSPRLNLVEVMLFEDWIKNKDKHSEEKKRILDPILRIKCVKDPPINFQLEAVRCAGETIKYIENPSLEVQLEAVRNNGYAIEYIPNPVFEVQLAAVSEDPYSIRYLRDPSEDIQLRAVSQDPYAIRYINGPCLSAQLEAMRRDGFCIKYISNPDEKTKIEAVRQNGFAIMCINEPSLEVQLEAVKTNAYCLRMIKKPFSETITAALSRDISLHRLYTR